MRAFPEAGRNFKIPPSVLEELSFNLSGCLPKVWQTTQKNSMRFTVVAKFSPNWTFSL